MKIEFLAEAQYELDETIEFYNNEVDGLGNEFLQEDAKPVVFLLDLFMPR